MGLSQTQVTLHSVFSGNPGTGKTTVARLMGRMFGAMGILKKGHLVETDRSGLVAEFAGQTAPKANKRIDEALDGVLFIDEAYSLVAESGDDPYGGEALQVLLKRMEDNRDRLIVVLAGYPKPLDRLLKSNPGLSSRFNRHFSFLDYTAGELGHIFQLLCEQNQYEIPPATRAKILTGFAHLLDVKDEHFGNGRLARNVFEMSIRRLANRIAKIAPLTREILTTIQPEDIIMEGVPAEVWNAMETDGVTFRVSCSKCSHTSKLPAKLLGRRVQCKKCQHSFAADWADVQLRQTEDV
jgi:SpoVK/Ycf46/Vps4 family AAA+-type ATPase